MKSCRVPATSMSKLTFSLCFCLFWIFLLVGSTSAFKGSHVQRSRPRLLSSTTTTTTMLHEKAKKSASKKSGEDEAATVETFKKAEFLNALADKTGMAKTDSEAMLNAVLDTITEAVVAGKRVNFNGFGTFQLRSRAARKGRNPKTGEPMDIKASKTPAFTAAKAFKEKANPTEE